MPAISRTKEKYHNVTMRHQARLNNLRYFETNFESFKTTRLYDFDVVE